MKLVRWLSLAVLFAGVGLVVWGQIAPPNTGKLSWDLYQLAAAGRTKRAADEAVAEISVLLVMAGEMDDDRLDGLRAAGYEITGSVGSFVLVRAPQDLFIDDTRGVDSMETVIRASLPQDGLQTERTPITDGTAWIQAEAAWGQGYRGQGARIAVIDQQFDTDNPVLSAADAQYYLIEPSGERLGAYRATRGEAASPGDHGTSCGIIAHDVAPEADVVLLSYPQDTFPVGWLLALDYAVRHLGVDVVSSSVESLQPFSHADGTGPLNAAVEGILEGSDTILVQSAGNWAMGSGSTHFFYAGTFTDSDGDHRHDFSPSLENAWDRNTLTFRASKGARIIIILEWDAWQAEDVSVDLDLYLYDHKYQEPLGSSLAQQIGTTNSPLEAITDLVLPYSGEFSLVIRDRGGQWHGSPAGPISFHLNVACLEGYAFPYVEHHTVCGSVREIAASRSPWVVTVGAANMGDGSAWVYSSRGLTSDQRIKPEIYAPAGVRGTTYVDGYGGTSAAAPYVAGVVALLRSAYPDASRDDLLGHLLSGGCGSEDACGNPLHVVDLARWMEE